MIRVVTPLIFVTLLVHVSVYAAANEKDLSLMQVAQDDSPAVVQITYWGEDMNDPNSFNVEGSGFLVGREGYFITAAHVLARYKPNSGQLSATFHQRDKNGAGLWFDIVEVEPNRDLALCKIRNFGFVKEPARKPDAKRPSSTYRQVTSLNISKVVAVPGELIAIIGYPLGSFASPVVQMGNIGATDAMLAVVPPFPGGRHDLLIVSVSGNHGDSGCPVISLRTGEVLGVIDQYVPAPLLTFPNGQTIPQQSGLMVALPSQWVLDILNRHGVKLTPITLQEDLVF